MRNNTDKENWIDGVLNSTQGISRAQPGNDLFDKINSKLNNYQEVKIIYLPAYIRGQTGVA